MGQLVHKKAASCLALTAVRKEEQNDLDTLIKNFKAGFNQNMESRRRWGGGIMGVKSNHIMAKREKAIQMRRQRRWAWACKAMSMIAVKKFGTNTSFRTRLSIG